MSFVLSDPIVSLSNYETKAVSWSVWRSLGSIVLSIIQQQQQQPRRMLERHFVKPNILAESCPVAAHLRIACTHWVIHQPVCNSHLLFTKRLDTSLFYWLQVQPLLGCKNFWVLEEELHKSGLHNLRVISKNTCKFAGIEFVIVYGTPVWLPVAGKWHLVWHFKAKLSIN